MADWRLLILLYEHILATFISTLNQNLFIQKNACLQPLKDNDTPEDEAPEP